SKAIEHKIRPFSSIYSSTGLREFSTNPFADYGTLFSQYAVFSKVLVSKNDFFNLVTLNWLRSKLPFNRGNGIEAVFLWEKINYQSLDRAEFHFQSTKSLKDIIYDERYYSESLDILNNASKSFFRLFAGKTGTDIIRIEGTLFEGFKSNEANLIKMLDSVRGDDVLAELGKYSEQKNKAHYEISDISVSEHIVDPHTLFNIRFMLCNPTSYPGYVIVRWDVGKGEKEIYIEPYTKKEIGLIAEEKPIGMNYRWAPFAEIRPKEIYFNDVHFDSKHTELFEGVRNIMTDNIPFEIIIDNLDDRCRIVTNKKKNLIMRFLENRGKNGSNLKLARFKGIEAPADWTLAEDSLDKPFYGPYNSVYYKKAGTGDTAIEYMVSLPEKGEYQLFLSIPKRTDFPPSMVTSSIRSGALGETTARVFAEDGIHEDTTDISNGNGEWEYVGTYSFSDTTAVIQITDKTNASIVIADALKLRKAE
ncbi:hypothetical protein ACFL6K_05370, partial [Candidatus Latescibacterota bacterium]